MIITKLRNGVYQLWQERLLSICLEKRLCIVCDLQGEEDLWGNELNHTALDQWLSGKHYASRNRKKPNLQTLCKTVFG